VAVGIPRRIRRRRANQAGVVRVPLLGLHGGSTIALGSISSEVGIRADLVL